MLWCMQVQAQRNQVPLAQVGPAQLPYAGCHTCADGVRQLCFKCMRFAAGAARKRLAYTDRGALMLMHAIVAYNIAMPSHVRLLQCP